MHRPFDDFAVFAAKMQASRVAPHRHGAEIKLRRIAAVDGNFVFTGRAALFEAREIHEGKANGALHLMDLGAGEKNHGAMRVDALDPHRAVFPATVGLSRKSIACRIGEKGEDLGLESGLIRSELGLRSGHPKAFFGRPRRRQLQCLYKRCRRDKRARPKKGAAPRQSRRGARGDYSTVTRSSTDLTPGAAQTAVSSTSRSCQP